MPSPKFSATLYKGAQKIPRGSYLRRIVSNTRNLTLSVWATNPLQCGLTYDVRVRVSFDNAATYCSFGSACQVGIAACAGLQLEHDGGIGATTGVVRMWPNPNHDGVVNLQLTELGFTQGTASIDVMDLFGKLVHHTNVAVEGSSANTTIDLSGTVAAGVYVVNITTGDQVHTERLVIQ